MTQLPLLPPLFLLIASFPLIPGSASPTETSSRPGFKMWLGSSISSEKLRGGFLSSAIDFIDSSGTRKKRFFASGCTNTRSWRIKHLQHQGDRQIWQTRRHLGVDASIINFTEIPDKNVQGPSGGVVCFLGLVFIILRGSPSQVCAPLHPASMACMANKAIG
ncbi:hypothetical protein OPV22_025804 [Ensete ventricosum]|uniref:Peptidase S1 domain-containing protein n=1 Tax=Ensete ventricosum TaxID=4639 RepID=A0AAV8PA06_ENSVE|nr:hypothetical protein OPV22_025804 [Ensete ventricosum]